MSRKIPNTEQEKAIYHSGGKLLSAGAGSGKTFVLIEHIVHLLSSIKDQIPVADWNKAVSQRLASTVLMTFTKKAAGEMSVRMMKKIEELEALAESEKELTFWKCVNQNLASLNITTIDGFCHKILRLGFWSDFPSEINVVKAIEHRGKVQKLFDQWFEKNQTTLDPLFLANSQGLLKAMSEIFASPEMRLMWSEPLSPKSAVEELNAFFTELLTMVSYRDLFALEIDLVCNGKEVKWLTLLKEFEQLRNKHGKVSGQNFVLYQNFFSSFKPFPRATKEISPEQSRILELLKDFRTDLEKYGDDLIAVQENYETYRSWVTTILNLFQYIESNYLTIDGFSFADLEYYVLKALKHPEVSIKVQENYHYFIVDEFQDTSFIQFEILKHLVGNNFSKLFCVGDRKQAIYGFRGGELQVFADCARMLGEENNYFLKNNFRSCPEVIDYNNRLFETVFPLGIEFDGPDPHSVPMEKQNIPLDEYEFNGEVVCYNTQVDGEVEDQDLDKLEAKILFEHIKRLMEDERFQSICVLYRKLSPSNYLLEEMLMEEIPFSAQVKIKFNDDPLLNLFLLLVEMELNQADHAKNRSSQILLQTLLNVLGVEEFSTAVLNQYFSDVKLIGVRLAFHKFVFSLGISNSFYPQNSDLIDVICRLTKEDLTQIYHLLKGEENGDYSCEMMSGEGKKRVTIMTAHASKGLEFDAVLLGGIHTNGRSKGMSERIGKWPHSFKWKKSFNQRNDFKSPFYYLESEMNKQKDFSESKRLLYVACTRAVKQLAFVNLKGLKEGVSKELAFTKNSWIHALRMIPVAVIEKDLPYFSEKKIVLPLIQQDSLGLMNSVKQEGLGIVSELSVTRLASLAECPFKFYLQNICKIDPGKQNLHDFSEEEEEGEIFYSSKERGTEVHSLLSTLFLGQITADKIPEKEKEKILWAYDLGKAYAHFTVVSEELIKFSFFGQMISGTPDLVFKNSDKLVIWDFKTGLRDENNESSYWFQLASYAYAYVSLLKLEEEKNIEMSLLYVDQKSCITKNLTVKEISQLLFSHWKKTQSLDQINPSHCPSCNYQTLCQKTKIHSA